MLIREACPADPKFVEFGSMTHGWVIKGDLAEAERLAHALIPDSANRDKFEMNEALRAAGIPATLQCAPDSWEEARDFLRGPCGFPAVVKPRRCFASISVGLAQTEDEARCMFDVLAADPTEQQAPVVQQFLRGDEWCRAQSPVPKP